MKYHENSFFTGIRDSEAGGTVRNAIAGIAERKSCRNGFERAEPSGRISPEYAPAREAAFRLRIGSRQIFKTRSACPLNMFFNDSRQRCRRLLIRFPHPAIFRRRMCFVLWLSTGTGGFFNRTWGNENDE